MTPLDLDLDRLLRAASAHPAPPSSAPVYGLETRVTAAWRASRQAAAWDTRLLTQGLLLAGILMTISLWPALGRGSDTDTEHLQLADSTVQTDQLP